MMKIIKNAKRCLLSVVAFSLIGATPIVHARDLIVALRAEPTALDPLYHALSANMQLSDTLFDSLVRMSKQAQPVPALAQSWDVDGNIWTFHLRKDITFTDGTPFTAADVLFSYGRAFHVPNSPSSYALYLSDIAKLEAIDEFTLRLTTKGPAPVLLANLATVPIMSHIAALKDQTQTKSTAQLNSGDGLVGTGPYQFVSWERGQEIVFKRNNNYWGSRPEWDKVIYKVLPDATARVSALLAGTVDIIEDPPTNSLIELRKDSRVYLQEVPSLRVIYIALNQNPKEKNPLVDSRVREALSLAIDRQAIVDRVMQGTAQAAGNLLAQPGFGASDKLAEAPKANMKMAKQRLAEAGYADGFNLTLGSPIGRYTNDQYIAQAVADMWEKIGVKVKLETAPPALFFKLRDQYAFGAYLGGWAVSTGEMLNPLRALVMTKDPAQGEGTTNWSHYSNPELDQMIRSASQTLTTSVRAKQLEQASELLMADYGILPLQFEMSVWAMKKDLRYDGRADQLTLAQDIYLAP